MALYKSIIVIWSEYDPTNAELQDLGRDASEGEAYCSKCKSELIDDPKADPDWDGTEFFDGSKDEDENSGKDS